MQGFGILGADVNHHAFHSVVGLIRLLGQSHEDNEEFLTHLSAVAQLCGSAYVFQQIPSDQVALANAILEKLSIL